MGEAARDEFQAHARKRFDATAGWHFAAPLGSREFVAELEKRLGRRLAPQKGGRPPTPGGDAGQTEFAFEEP